MNMLSKIIALSFLIEFKSEIIYKKGTQMGSFKKHSVLLEMTLARFSEGKIVGIYFSLIFDRTQLKFDLLFHMTQTE
jgi:hypothetical protein